MKKTARWSVVICGAFLVAGGPVAEPAQAQDRTTGVERNRIDTAAEANGEAAERSGQYYDAFYAYVTAFRNLPQPVSASDEQRLRRRIIEVVNHLGARPPIPPEALAHFDRASALLEAEVLLGNSGTGSAEAVAAELKSAIALAPWWPEATLKLATILQKLQRFDEALANLTLYRLADPDGYAAAIAAKGRVTQPVAKPRATIYVYWPRQARDGGGTVRCNESKVAELKEGRFVIFSAAPGTHRIGLDSARVSISAEGSRTYYFRGSTEGFPAGTRMRAVEPAEAVVEMLKTGMSANDADRTFRDECANASVTGKSGQR